MSHRKPFYDSEFKKNIVNVYNTGRSPSSIVNEYGISISSIYKWLDNEKHINLDIEKCNDPEKVNLSLEDQIDALIKERDTLIEALKIVSSR